MNDAEDQESASAAAPTEIQRSPPIDLTSLETGLTKWLAKFKGKAKKIPDEDYVPIHGSLFAVLGKSLSDESPIHAPQDDSKTLNATSLVTPNDFESITEDVRSSIAGGKQPRLNNKGSSGSYFMENSLGEIVGIFKPKNEEPYGSLNPKWTKWFHRNFLAPVIGFGRSCLIPNLGYLSETAASVLDRRLETHIVPRTGYQDMSKTDCDRIDRRAANTTKNPTPLPEKIGSLQLFAQGFEDATEFLARHPLPGEDGAVTFQAPKRRKQKNPIFRAVHYCCGKAEAPTELKSEDSSDESENTAFEWTPALLGEFRLQLEHLAVLDYCMRNTDRGLDNFMIACTAPKRIPKDSKSTVTGQPFSRSPKSTLTKRRKDHCEPHIHIAAIDNGLAFPIHHPRGWRGYNYGWLWLPESIIGLPWSQAIRHKLLKLLTNPVWWEITIRDLRITFKQDQDFDAFSFRKQMAVLKGQAYNLVESLKNSDEGPTELCQRPPILIWDDYFDLSDLKDSETQNDLRHSHGDEREPLLSHVMQSSPKSPFHRSNVICQTDHAEAGGTWKSSDKQAAARASHQRSSSSRERPLRPSHMRWASQIMASNSTQGYQIVVVERLEEVSLRPFFTNC